MPPSPTPHDRPNQSAKAAPPVTALGAPDRLAASPVPLLAPLLAAVTVGQSRLPAAWMPAPMEAALTALGARVSWRDTGVTVRGRGLGGLTEPAAPLDLAGLPAPAPALALMAGLLATQPMVTVLLTPAEARPSEALITTLERIGARLVGAGPGRRSPLTLVGTAWPQALDLTAAAQSDATPTVALMALAAGLNCPGETRVPLPGPMAEPLARLLTAFGVPTRLDPPALAGGSPCLCLIGEAETVPVDLSEGS